MRHLINLVIRFLVIGYIHIYVLSITRFSLRLKGLGIALRTIRKDFVFLIQNLNFWFNPQCAAAYCVMPGGYWNEPETHVFFDSVLANISGSVAFIDVGASIGEMVIPMAKHNNVHQVIAFEPQIQCAEAIRKSAILNDLTNITVMSCAASEKCGNVNFSASINNPTAAAVSIEAAELTSVPCTTIDEAVYSMGNDKIIMLIDVEGHEPSVMRGAIKLINSSLPLIIFEYNETSKKHFSLDDIRHILPDSYKFYRLRPNGDGRLDNDLVNTWNCVAVAENTEFDSICKTLIVS